MLGEELKRRREELGLTLAQISESTRIGTRFLKAIEENDYGILPEGIYTRSFIRAYARHVKMNEEEALKVYSEETGQREKLADPDPSEIEKENAKFVYQEPSGGLLPATLAAGVLALILVGGSFAFWQYSRSQQTAPADAAATPQKAAQPDIPPTPVAEQPTAQVGAPGQGLQVTLAASDDCWISYAADAAKPTQLLLKGGMQQQIQATESINLSIGNTQAVQMRINGRDAHFPADTGVVLKKLTITPETASALVK
jgi:cytoskeletal protein RodZ